ncbi:MAG: hypothetical protein NTX25_03035 [Proteobacteria bacterium]|nr:hypothetical protein [Pseudomonadota bacterium]
MKSVAHRPDIILDELAHNSNRLTVHAHWMAFILLAGEGGKITFKAHYSSGDIQSIVALALNKNLDEINSDLISDFMREYCNLTAGFIKSRLAQVGIHAGLSIPIVTRGFDEIWRMDRDISNEIVSVDAWRLKLPSGSVICTMAARSDVWAAAQDLKDAMSNSSQESDMEYL